MRVKTVCPVFHHKARETKDSDRNSLTSDRDNHQVSPCAAARAPLGETTLTHTHAHTHTRKVHGCDTRARPKACMNRVGLYMYTVYVHCICTLYMYTVYVHCICTPYMYTVYVHRIWPYVWWFPCQKHRMYTVYLWFWPTLPENLPECETRS